MAAGPRITRTVEGCELPRVRAALAAIGVVGLATWPLEHRLFMRLCRYTSEALGSDASVVVHMAPDARLEVRLDDSYWMRLIARCFSYEPEVDHLLRRLRGLSYSFVDCGANVGYWSVLASSAEFGGHRVVAIEASGRLCERLRRNSAINGSRFEVLHAAVSDRSGHRVALKTGRMHTSASIHHVAGPIESREDVRTLALDDLELSEPLVIKLDVEGAEVEAMLGARGLLERGALLVYEDHGMDPACRHTRAALDMGLGVRWISPRGRLERVLDLDMVRRRKRRHNRGYNLVATSPDSPFNPRLEA